MTSLALILAAPIAVSAALAIASLERRRRNAHYVFKPLTMALVIAIPLAGLAEGGLDRYGLLVLAGLCFSIVGDVLLMVEFDLFVAGLASFLVAHLFYVAAFVVEIARHADAFPPRDGAFFAPLLLLVPSAVVMVRAMRPGLGSLVLPVAAYVCVIAVMGWLATAMWLVHPDRRSAAAAVGALLFMTSDSVLALDKFRAPIRFAQPLLLATYFAAQWFFAASV